MSIFKSIANSCVILIALLTVAACQQGATGPGAESTDGAFIGEASQPEVQPADQDNEQSIEATAIQHPNLERADGLLTEFVAVNNIASLNPSNNQVEATLVQAGSGQTLRASNNGYPFMFLSQREGKKVEGAITKSIYQSNTGALEKGTGLTQMNRVTNNFYNPTEHNITDLDISQDGKSIAFILSSRNMVDKDKAPEAGQVYVGNLDGENRNWKKSSSTISDDKRVNFSSLAWNPIDNQLIIGTLEYEKVNHPTAYRERGWKPTSSTAFVLNLGAEEEMRGEPMANSAITYTATPGRFTMAGSQMHKIKASPKQSNAVLLYYGYTGNTVSGNFTTIKAQLADGSTQSVFSDRGAIGGKISSFSPAHNGKELIFINDSFKIGTCNLSDRGQCDNVRLVDLKSKLPGIVSSYNMCVTGDDKKVLFDARIDDNTDIYMFDRATESVTRLTYAEHTDSNPVCFKGKETPIDTNAATIEQIENRRTIPAQQIEQNERNSLVPSQTRSIQERLAR